jgi:hypothetical protein
MGAESLDRFDQLVGASSWDDLRPLLHAQILSLQGDVGSALALYEEHMPKIEIEGALRLQANLLADQAWCRLRAGLKVAARDATSLALASIESSSQVDDRAAAHSRLHQVLVELGEAELAKAQEGMAIEAWAQYERVQAKIVELLVEMPVPRVQSSV